MHRRHDVLRFEEHRQKHRRRWFFKNIAKTLHRQGKNTMFYMMFLVLGTLFKAMTKAWLFSQKCNPE